MLKGEGGSKSAKFVLTSYVNDPLLGNCLWFLIQRLLLVLWWLPKWKYLLFFIKMTSALYIKVYKTIIHYMKSSQSIPPHVILWWNVIPTVSYLVTHTLSIYSIILYGVYTKGVGQKPSGTKAKEPKAKEGGKIINWNKNKNCSKAFFLPGNPGNQVMPCWIQHVSIEMGLLILTFNGWLVLWGKGCEL